MAKNYHYVHETRDEAGFIIGASYTAWDCEKCGTEVRRYRGVGDVDCPNCGACYNASGQRLRDDWRDNPSWKYGDCDDMTGLELQYAGDE